MVTRKGHVVPSERRISFHCYCCHNRLSNSKIRSAFKLNSINSITPPLTVAQSLSTVLNIVIECLKVERILVGGTPESFDGLDRRAYSRGLGQNGSVAAIKKKKIKSTNCIGHGATGTAILARLLGALPVRNIAEFCSVQWHALGREEQAKYYELARRERQLHMQLYPDWSSRANATRGKKRKRKQDPADGGRIFLATYYCYGISVV